MRCSGFSGQPSPTPEAHVNPKAGFKNRRYLCVRSLSSRDLEGSRNEAKPKQFEKGKAVPVQRRKSVELRYSASRRNVFHRAEWLRGTGKRCEHCTPAASFGGKYYERASYDRHDDERPNRVDDRRCR